MSRDADAATPPPKGVATGTQQGTANAQALAAQEWKTKPMSTPVKTRPSSLILKVGDLPPPKFSSGTPNEHTDEHTALNEGANSTKYSNTTLTTPNIAAAAKEQNSNQKATLCEKIHEYLRQYVEKMIGDTDITLIRMLPHITKGYLSAEVEKLFSPIVNHSILFLECLGFRPDHEFVNAWRNALNRHIKNTLVQQSPCGIEEKILEQMIPNTKPTLLPTKDHGNKNYTSFSSRVTKHLHNHLIAQLIIATYDQLQNKNISTEKASTIAKRLIEKSKTNLDGLLSEKIIFSLDLSKHVNHSKDVIDAFIQNPKNRHREYRDGVMNTLAFLDIINRMLHDKSPLIMTFKQKLISEENPADVFANIVLGLKPNPEQLIRDTSVTEDLEKIVLTIAKETNTQNSPGNTDHSKKKLESLTSQNDIEFLYSFLNNTDFEKSISRFSEECHRHTKEIEVTVRSARSPVKPNKEDQNNLFESPNPGKTHPQIVQTYQTFFEKLSDLAEYVYGKDLFCKSRLISTESLEENDTIKQKIHKKLDHILSAFTHFFTLIAPHIAAKVNPFPGDNLPENEITDVDHRIYHTMSLSSEIRNLLTNDTQSSQQKLGMRHAAFALPLTPSTYRVSSALSRTLSALHHEFLQTNNHATSNLWFIMLSQCLNLYPEMSLEITHTTEFAPSPKLEALRQALETHQGTLPQSPPPKNLKQEQEQLTASQTPKHQSFPVNSRRSSTPKATRPTSEPIASPAIRNLSIYPQEQAYCSLDRLIELARYRLNSLQKNKTWKFAITAGFFGGLITGALLLACYLHQIHVCKKRLEACLELREKNQNKAFRSPELEHSLQNTHWGKHRHLSRHFVSPLSMFSKPPTVISNIDNALSLWEAEKLQIASA